LIKWRRRRRRRRRRNRWVGHVAVCGRGERCVHGSGVEN